MCGTSDTVRLLQPPISTIVFLIVSAWPITLCTTGHQMAWDKLLRGRPLSWHRGARSSCLGHHLCHVSSPFNNGHLWKKLLGRKEARRQVEKRIRSWHLLNPTGVYCSASSWGRAMSSHWGKSLGFISTVFSEDSSLKWYLEDKWAFGEHLVEEN